MTPPSKEPVAIEYKRWNNKNHGYEVTVLAVHHRQGEHGWYTWVIVQGSRRSRDTRVNWPAKVFLRTFSPLGRKLKFPNRWDLIGK